eukprot:c14456_g1_i2 orf=768-2465(-)
MRLSTIISCTKDGQARTAMAMFQRWQSGGPAAAYEESSPCSAFAREQMQGQQAKKGGGQLEFVELEHRQVQLSLDSSEATQAPSLKPEADKNFSKTSSNQHHNNVPKQEHAHAYLQRGDPLARFTQPLHQPALRPRSLSVHHNHALPIRRVWQCAPHTTQTPSQDSFVITSFNILASSHAETHRHLYLSVPTDLLSWSTRRKKVLQVLESCSPDIICLQEVDKFKDLEEDLALRGYTGLYKVRTGEMPDGCATFWRKARFQLLQERSFEFSMLGMRNNVAQLCVLQLIVPGVANGSRNEEQFQSHRLVVGNIHVLFNPKRGDIKLGQCRAFLEQVHNMSSIWHGAPVVIGGDFNSTPSSAVYKYLATSELDLSNLDRRYVSGLGPEVLNFYGNKSGKEVQGRLKEMSVGHSTAELASQEEADEPASSTLDESGSSLLPSYVSRVETLEQVEILAKGWDLEELRVATGKTHCALMQHELNLYSAYSDIQGQAHTRDAKGEPLLTTCHKEFSGTVDYIWRNEGLKTTKVLETVPVTAFTRNKGLPLVMGGSDHLALACELAFTDLGN